MNEYNDISKKIDEAKEEAKRTGKPVIVAVQESDYIPPGGCSCKTKISQKQQIGRQLRGRTSVMAAIDDQDFIDNEPKGFLYNPIWDANN
jgi:hypothetical protein